MCEVIKLGERDIKVVDRKEMRRRYFEYSKNGGYTIYNLYKSPSETKIRWYYIYQAYLTSCGCYEVSAISGNTYNFTMGAKYNCNNKLYFIWVSAENIFAMEV